MSRLRRYPAEGRPVFITSVTHQRRPLLIEHVDLLWQACDMTRARVDFSLHAWVVVPDHFHFIIDPKGESFSAIVQRIKMGFAASWTRRVGITSGRTWQHRFWDHIIRDQDDLSRHLDYIHINPVRHGYVDSPFDWSHSSIHHFRSRGIYGPDWGTRDVRINGENFGE